MTSVPAWIEAASTCAVEIPAIATSAIPGSNGAQLMLRTGNTTAAIAFLNTAIGHLQDPSARGVQTGTIPAILNLLVTALNAGA